MTLDQIHGQEVLTLDYQSHGKVVLSGTELTLLTQVYVKQYLDDGTELQNDLEILKQTDEEMTLGFNQTSVFKGEIDLCDSSSNCITYEWNPSLVVSVSNVPTEGGVITVNGEYLQQSNEPTANTMELSDIPLTLEESGSKPDGTMSMFKLSTLDAEKITARSTNILLTIRGSQYDQILQFKSPNITSVQMKTPTSLVINGSSFGAVQKSVYVVINGVKGAIISSFIKHKQVVVAIPQLFTRPGPQSISLQIQNSTSNQYTYTIKPIVDSVTPCSSNGGWITISGRYLDIGNTSSAATDITIANFYHCSRSFNLGNNGTMIVCMMPSAKPQVSDPSMPVQVTINGYASDALSSSAKFYYIHDSDAGNTKHIPIWWIIVPVVGGVLLIAVAVLLFVLCRRRRRRMNNKDHPYHRKDNELVTFSANNAIVHMKSQPNNANGLIIVEEDGCTPRVKGGKFESLVQYLCFSKETDETFIKVFLLSFRAFATRMQLMDQLILCYEMIEAKLKYYPEALDTTKEVQHRIASIVARWLGEHRYDFIDNTELSEKMTRFIQRKIKRECPQVFDKILTYISPEVSSVFMSNGNASSQTKTVPVHDPTESPPIPVLPKKRGSEMTLLDLSSIEVARQITLWESGNHRAVEEKEFFHLSTSIEKILYDIPNLLKLTGHFINISSWVTGEIMTKKDMDTRINVIEKFIDIATELKHIANYNGCFEILDGLKHPMVQYLAKTWTMIDPISLATYKELNSIFSEDHNYAAYRSLLRSNSSPSTLPFGKLFKLDVGRMFTIENKQWIQNGNGQSMLDVFSKVPKLINFDFFMDIWRVVEDFKRYQSTAPNYLIEENTINYIKNYKCPDNPPSTTLSVDS
ncbi:hypothetical protein SAMD00019534_094050 [Acytostelium subglobosum LB1]|uniref:hypothetical protein n=1 Tax=Acytostelium subglobosum LB1 TaxID=1410327 RepID=UPI000644D31B|nr:hypothetical protein SAMD00019534_094050 [Acytostelium subglobosum LB1]GAM26230.1 hypothetical protein SAMD00019534_094050 [Acytostelium subglobosum LB1]|eukprot:XP_012750784.1 hypothetical protein SAMD00019534_094050 [Acytostelium subglobosum LB1]